MMSPIDLLSAQEDLEASGVHMARIFSCVKRNRLYGVCIFLGGKHEVAGVQGSVFEFSKQVAVRRLMRFRSSTYTLECRGSHGQIMLFWSD